MGGPLGILYGVALAAYAAGLVRGRAPSRVWLLAPLAVVILLFVDNLIYELVVGPLLYHMGMPKDGLGEFIIGTLYDVVTSYGEAADTLVENCGNTLILRCSASERGGTSEFASKLIGQREVLHTTQSRSTRPNEWLPTLTTSQQVRIKPAVMASEIEQLPDLHGFLKLASAWDWKRVRLTRRDYASVARQRRAEPTSSANHAAVPKVREPETMTAEAAPVVPLPPPRPAPQRRRTMPRKAKRRAGAADLSAQANDTADGQKSPGPEGPSAGSGSASTRIEPVGEPLGGAELPP